MDSPFLSVHLAADHPSIRRPHLGSIQRFAKSGFPKPLMNNSTRSRFSNIVVPATSCVRPSRNTSPPTPRTRTDPRQVKQMRATVAPCLLYTSDAADEE